MSEPIDADQTPGCAHPRETLTLWGHEDAERAFEAAYRAGRLHHAWLITGPQGIGKATLAYRMARRVLGARSAPEHGVLGADPQDAVSRRIAAQGHGDLVVLRRPWDAAKGRARTEIPVDAVRNAIKLFTQKAAEGGWRVAIVDAADDLNPNAANGLLKALEEPPPFGLFLLVSHAPGRLLPTIRSRCRVLRLTAPGIDIAARVALAQGAGSEDAARRLADIAKGSPGRAAALAANDGDTLAAAAAEVANPHASTDPTALRRLAQSLAGKDAEARRGLFFELLRQQLADQARAGAGEGARAVDALAGVWEALGALQARADGLYLDPKQTVLEAAALVREAAARPISSAS
ncbi:MAG: DNA polymerase III subunit delta' [Maricaulaceae bacterium]